MKVLITGANGMLGSKAAAVLDADHDVHPVDIKDFDICDEQAVRRYISHYAPDCILHCAAYTAVDQAEDDEERCMAVNGDGSKNIAKAANDVDALLCYYSTDYVFDGMKGSPYVENDEPAPIGVYGRSKRYGEEMILTHCPKHHILRITWLFGENGTNFPRTMLTLADDRDELRVVQDQHGSPTYTVDVLRQTQALFDSDAYGIWHSSAEGVCSWFDVAKEVFHCAGKEIRLTPVTSEEFPTKAKRPVYSYLENKRLKDAGLHCMPAWQDGIRRYVSGLHDG